MVFIVQGNDNTSTKVTLDLPSGQIQNSSPVFSWTKNPSSIRYQLWVNNSTGTAFTKWYTASEKGCDSGAGNYCLTVNMTNALKHNIITGRYERAKKKS